MICLKSDLHQGIRRDDLDNECVRTRNSKIQERGFNHHHQQFDP